MITACRMKKNDTETTRQMSCVFHTKTSFLPNFQTKFFHLNFGKISQKNTLDEKKILSRYLMITACRMKKNDTETTRQMSCVFHTITIFLAIFHSSFFFFSSIYSLLWLHTAQYTILQTFISVKPNTHSGQVFHFMYQLKIRLVNLRPAINSSDRFWI